MSRSVIICIALLVAVANAQFGIPFPIFGGGGDLTRIVTCSGGTTTKSFTSIRAGFSGSDTLDVDMTTSPVPAVKFVWATSSFSGVGVLKVTAAFPDVVEFEPGLTAGYSVSKGGVSLNLTWDISASNCDSGSANHYWTTFSANNGTVQINCTLPTASFTVNGLTITPNSVKCDLIVTNYQYTSATSRLALKSQFLYQSTTVGLGVASTCGFGLCVSATNGKGHAYLDWVNTADINVGGNLNVIANFSTSTHDSTYFTGFIGTDVFFTFDSHASSFLWDPAFGVTDGAVNPVAAPTSAASANSVSFALAAIIVILAVFFH
jgi:hypothetical protein